MQHYYIYYRVRHEHVAWLKESVGQMQARLLEQMAPSKDLHFHLRQRLDADQTDTLTWMEVYEGLAAASAPDFLLLLEQHLVRTGLAQWIVGPRHLECFTD